MKQAEPHSSIPEFVVIVTFTKAPAGIAQSEHRIRASSAGTAVGRAINIAQRQLKGKTRHRGLWAVGRVSWQVIETDKPNKQGQMKQEPPEHVERLLRLANRKPLASNERPPEREGSGEVNQATRSRGRGSNGSRVDSQPAPVAGAPSHPSGSGGPAGIPD